MFGNESIDTEEIDANTNCQSNQFVYVYRSVINEFSV